jgi:hypothetical protein
MTIPPSLPTQALPVEAAFAQPAYLLRRKALRLIGAQVDIFDASGTQLCLCAHKKGFKLKEDIRIYTDVEKSRELLTIQARQIIDFSAAYDVTDAATGQRIGTLRRKGWSSMLRDSWEVMDAQEQLVATIQEDQMILALIRRFIDLASVFLPQAFHFTMTSGAEVCRAKQQFNPFIHKMDLAMPQGALVTALDPRLVLASTVLLVLIEGRQR